MFPRSMSVKGKKKKSLNCGKVQIKIDHCVTVKGNSAMLAFELIVKGTVVTALAV